MYFGLHGFTPTMCDGTYEFNIEKINTGKDKQFKKKKKRVKEEETPLPILFVSVIFS